MKKILFTLLIVSSFSLYAQEALLVDSLLTEGWTPAGVVGINLSQTAFQNWAQGGSNSLAFVLYTNLGLAYVQDSWKWKNRLNVAYGRTKLEGIGYRTTDNDIYFQSVLSKNIGWVVDPYVAITFRSAVTKGFDYTVDPAVQIVDFFDPGYLTEAVGFAYDHGGIVTSRLGIAFQETFADQFALRYTDDPETPNEIEDFKFETGLESVTELKYDFLPNMNYSSFLRLFTRFKALDVWDVRWDNIVTAKVNEFINVNLTVTLIHEISQTRRTQLREALQLGFAYRIF